tara:strand:- start:2017 stop:2901 length:885 start_codon:yes stop_codon:yes gene_type:complete
MAQYSTYDQIGLKEDVSSLITTISPTETPFTTLIKSEKCSARVFEWQEDTIRAGTGNAQIEGHTFTAGTITPTTMRTNNTQILSETFEVTATSDIVAAYGRAKESAYQLARTLKSIKKDLEHAYVGVDNAAVTGNSSTAREMASATQQISTSVDAGTNATDPMTEAKLLELHEDCYDNGSDPNVLMIKPADATIVSGFAASSGRTRDFDTGTALVNVIDLYVSSFGELRVTLNRNQLTTHAFLIDPAMWRSVVLRPFTRELLAKTSDSSVHAVVGEYSLKHMNFGADGMLTGLS